MQSVDNDETLCFIKKYITGEIIAIMNICVYGAASDEILDVYTDKGEELGKQIAKHKHNLIFGGGDGGMMGAVAKGVHENGGYITGVVPTFFNVDGILYENCDEMIRPETMRERKQIMEEKAEAFIMTPGGIGTFEEFFEILTLKQLGRHTKPIVILNINDYFSPIIKMLTKAIDQRFMTKTSRKLWFVTNDIDVALQYIEEYEAKEFNILELRSMKNK